MVYATFKKGLVLLIILYSFQSFSQSIGSLKKFSKESSLFVQEMNKFMSVSNNDNLKKVFKLFSNSFESLKVSEQQSVISISNKMLGKQLRANPHFSQFLSSLVIVNNHQNGSSMLPQWLSVFDKTLDHSTTKKLMIFCAFTDNLVKDKVLRSSKTATWSTDADDYSFKFQVIEPVVIFNTNFNLNCSTESDSYSIFNTKGKYYLLSNEWEGINGEVNWSNHNLHIDSVYSLLSKYKIDTRKSILICDSVSFFNKSLFSLPIIGELIHKLASSRQSKNFPKFTSYSKNVELKDIFPDVDYRGGFIMKGKEFIADGGIYAQARMVFKKNGRDIFIANSNRFSISSDRITAKSAGINIFFDSDSIYHSNLQFKYINSDRSVQLYRDRNGISGAPMLSTYHKITIDFELLNWNIDEDRMTFGSLPGSSESIVNFESADLFLKSRFVDLQGIDAMHPLLLIKKYATSIDSDIFYVKDFARFARKSMIQIQHFLINIANKGFIFYDHGSEIIKVQPILYNYINAASEIGDYDVIAFNSKVKSGRTASVVNAVLDITTKDLVIEGVPVIELSDKRDVYFVPYAGKMIVKKNRDFIFNGEIFAGKGRLSLFGRNFFFNYDEFKVVLNEIDSVQLSVPIYPLKKDMYGNNILTKVKTVIEAVTGDLRIDNPSNKSGIRSDSFPNYPIFRSFEDSYAYYDKRSVYNGVYNRSDFSFHLQPFEFDSLDSYTGMGLWFAGSFESSNIFPTFDDTLRLQKDYSLGFNRKAPVDGFSIYKGKAKYFNDIYLSDSGLRGSGELNYLTSEVKSDRIYFFPDSTNLVTTDLIIKEVATGIEFPSVRNSETYVHFLPYDDEFSIEMIQNEFNFYKDQAKFNGNLMLQPTGLTGSGIMTLEMASVTAELFTYNAKWFGSEKADLDVFAHKGALAIKAKNLRSHIDLDRGEGIFNKNGDNSYVEFPANQYLSYIDKLRWVMNEEKFILGDNIASSVRGLEFISFHPLQDSLSFMANTANYNLKDYIINLNGVDDIMVADAIIYPDSGFLIIMKDAIIPTLYNAKILADDLNRYHIFTGAAVDIISAQKYTGSGDYTYSDAMNQKQKIFFKDILVNKDTVTIANGDVDSEKPLHIDSKFDFKGSLNLFADRKNLTFDGYFMTNHSCELLEKEWVKFRSEIDPADIVFELEEKNYNDNEDLLSSSIVMSLDSTDIYSTFLSRKDRGVDFDLIKASYNLTYNNDKLAYVIGRPDTISNYFTLNDKKCKTLAVGIVDMNLDLGQVSVRTIGKFRHDLRNRKKDFEGFFMLDFLFSNEAMLIMKEDLYGAPGDELFEYDKNFSNNLSRIVGEQRSEALMIELEMKDEFVKFPDEMNHSIVFAKTKLKWDNYNKAYVAKGAIAVSSIMDNQVNSILDGYIIIDKGQNSDILTIYMQTELYDEYYFQYKNGVMRAWSTNEEFNIAIKSTPDGKRKAEAKKGSIPYRYMSAPEDVTEKFLKAAKKKY